MHKACIYIFSLLLLLNFSQTLQAQNNELLGSYKIAFIGKDKGSSRILIKKQSFAKNETIPEPILKNWQNIPV